MHVIGQLVAGGGGDVQRARPAWHAACAERRRHVVAVADERDRPAAAMPQRSRSVKTSASA